MSRVYALGGSVVERHLSEIEQLASALESGEQVVVVTGAGHLKKNQEAVRDLTSRTEIDMVGRYATRLNAKTLQVVMDGSYPGVPDSIEEVQRAVGNGNNVVMGGLVSGFSTDAVAALVAEALETDLYIVTDVDGVYTEDPDQDPDAEKLDEIGIEKLSEMSRGRNEPGIYSVIDSSAVEIMRRSEIPVRLFEGSLENIEDPGNASGTDIRY